MEVNNIYNLKSNIISRWWKRYNVIINLRKIYNIIKNELTEDDLQELINKCNGIINKCKGDGAGLTSGILIDMLLCDFLKLKISKYNECHIGECDIKIDNIPLSVKKINGKSSIALDWSKNKDKDKKEHFICDILIINLKTEKWWKNNPKIINTNIKITYNDIIPSGIYIIDKQFCKYYIKLTNNNKTNTIIESQYLYLMLKRSILLNLFIPFPFPNKIIEFNIMNAFL